MEEDLSGAGRYNVVASTSTTEEEGSSSRQAGPIPVKVGELGYDEEVARRATASSGQLLSMAAAIQPRHDAAASSESLSGPHPAERSRQQQYGHQHSNSSSSSVLPALPTDEHGHGSTRQQQQQQPPPHTPLPSTIAPAGGTLVANNSSSSIDSNNSLQRIKKHMRLSNSKRYLLGATPRTVIRFFIQIIVLTLTIVGWIFAIRHISASSSSTGNDNNNDPNSAATSTLSTASGSIFIHVAFAVAVLLQLLFLERCIFLLRAERYVFLHPEAANSLPGPGGPSRSRGPGGPGGRMPYAPWNRPPLPTYAAALGFRGTGDAEDNEIARIVAMGSGDVPPQYGNVRGSTLLAYGPRSTANVEAGRRMRAVSGVSERSWANVVREETTEGTESRPVSYGQSEQIEDAFRAQRLEEALAKLESGPAHERAEHS